MPRDRRGDARADIDEPAVCDRVRRPGRVSAARRAARAVAGIGVRCRRRAGDSLQSVDRGRLGRWALRCEERPFQPHLTLARWREVAPRSRSAPRPLAAASAQRLSRRRRRIGVTLYQSRLSSRARRTPCSLARAAAEVTVPALMSSLLLLATASGRCRSRCCWRGAGARRSAAVGSGNLGAANVLRASASRPACWSRCSTSAKGGERRACRATQCGAPAAAAGVAAIVGHIYPVVAAIPRRQRRGDGVRRVSRADAAGAACRRWRFRRRRSG